MSLFSRALTGDRSPSRSLPDAAWRAWVVEGQISHLFAKRESWALTCHHSHTTVHMTTPFHLTHTQIHPRACHHPSLSAFSAHQECAARSAWRRLTRANLLIGFATSYDNYDMLVHISLSQDYNPPACWFSDRPGSLP